MNLGPDAVGMDFRSYRSNALFIERVGIGMARIVFASEAGQTFRVDVSHDASVWSPYSTNSTEATASPPAPRNAAAVRKSKVVCSSAELMLHHALTIGPTH